MSLAGNRADVGCTQVISNFLYSNPPSFILWELQHRPDQDSQNRGRDAREMPSANQRPRTLSDKVFQNHIMDELEDGTILLYIGTKLLSNHHLLYADIVHR